MAGDAAPHTFNDRGHDMDRKNRIARHSQAGLNFAAFVIWALVLVVVLFLAWVVLK